MGSSHHATAARRGNGSRRRSILLAMGILGLIACGGSGSGSTAGQPETSSGIETDDTELTTSSTVEQPPTTALATGDELSGDGVTVGVLPEGFVPWGDPHRVSGPLAGSSVAAQEYRNLSTTQSVTVAITVGIPTESNVLDPEGRPFRELSERSVQGRPTYIADLTAVSSQLQLGFVLDATTMVWVTGYNLAWDDVFEIAESVRFET
jgi:hypothetical protein